MATSKRTRPRVTTLPGLAPLMEGRKLTGVAFQLKIDQSTLSLVVDCKRGASLAMAWKLARYFGTSIETLLIASEEARSCTNIAN